MKDVTVFRLDSIEYGFGLTGDWLDPFYLAVNSPAYTVLQAGETEPYRPVVAAAEIGRGRAVIYPQNLDKNLDEADNSYFVRNALYWLQQKEIP